MVLGSRDILARRLNDHVFSYCIKVNTVLLMYYQYTSGNFEAPGIWEHFLKTVQDALRLNNNSIGTRLVNDAAVVSMLFVLSTLNASWHRAGKLQGADGESRY